MGRGCHREPSPLQHRCPRPGVKEGLITAGPHWGILAPGGLSCKQQWGGRAHSTPQPFYPAPSLHYHVLLVSQVPHSQPYLGTVLPPSPLPGPYRVKAHPVPGGGEHCGGRCRSIICCCSFSSALVTGSCVLERPRAWGRALWGRGVPIASALTAVGRGWEWGAGRGGFGVTAPLQRDTAAGILCMVLKGGGGDPKSGGLCPSVPHKRNILGVMP